MAGLSDLADIAPIPELSDIERHETREPSTLRRYTDFEPRQRGAFAPVLGRVGEARAMASLAQSGGGWINRDGRVLSNGSGLPDDAIRQIPEIAAAHEAVEAFGPALEAKVNAAFELALAEHKASGRSAREFAFNGYDMDASDFKDLPQIEPTTHVRSTIREAGWSYVTLQRNRGVKEISVHLDRFDRRSMPALVQLAEALDCRVVQGRRFQDPTVLYQPGPAAAMDDEPAPAPRF